MDVATLTEEPQQGGVFGQVGEEPRRPASEHDSCRVGSLAVSEPVTVHAIWESARLSHNGGNNRGGGIDFAGFAPPPLRDKTCLIFNTIGVPAIDQFFPAFAILPETELLATAIALAVGAVSGAAPAIAAARTSVVDALARR